MEEISRDSAKIQGHGRFPPVAAAQVRKPKGFLVPAGRLNKPTVWCIQGWVILGHSSISAITRARRAKLLAGQACPGVYLGPGPSSVSSLAGSGT